MCTGWTHFLKKIELSGAALAHINCKQEYCGDNVPYMRTSRGKAVKSLPDFNLILVVYRRCTLSGFYPLFCLPDYITHTRFTYLLPDA